MDIIINKHLALWRREPFSWADGRDCMLRLADYLFDLTGHDCGTRFRGKYRTRRECMKVSGFHRDPVKPLADCLEEFPLERTETPQRGDVGVVVSSDGPCGGLCLGNHWAAPGENGLVVGIPSEILAAWRQPNA